MHFVITFLLFITVLLLPAAAEHDTTPPTLTVNVLPENGTVQVYGTVNDASGIDRVEVKFNGDSWRTANLNGSNFSITEEINVTGNHVVQVRAFDTSGNPSPIDTKSFYAVKKQSASDDDLSFFIRLTSVKITALNLSGNVREMESPQDFAVEFDIMNDDSAPHRLRYRIDVNGEEITEDVTLQAGRTKEVDEWYGASILNVGQNRIKISVIDWETKQTITDKTITLNVKAAEKPEALENLSAETPEWLKEFAELNGLALPQNKTNALNTTDLELKIAKLESKIAVLESSTPEPTPQETNWSKFVWPAVIVLVAVVVFLIYRSGKLDGLIQIGKKDVPDPEVDLQE